jgi:hypothetical protein
MSDLWYIAFGLGAGVFAFIGQCLEDANRIRWRPYWTAFKISRSYRRGMGIQLVACACGGAVFGALVAALQWMLK